MVSKVVYLLLGEIVLASLDLINSYVAAQEGIVCWWPQFCNIEVWPAPFHLQLSTVSPVL